MLSSQPMNSSPTDIKKQVLTALEQNTRHNMLSKSLMFTTQNFFALGSPAGVMLLLKGYRITSRKECSKSGTIPNRRPLQFCYPAVENLYNIFHKVIYEYSYIPWVIM